MKKSPISTNSLYAQHFVPHALVMSSADKSGQQCRGLSIKFPNIHPPDSFDTAVNHNTYLIHDCLIDMSFMGFFFPYLYYNRPVEGRKCISAVIISSSP